METTILKKIVVPFGNAKKIAKALGCTHISVSYALNGKKSTELSKKIRFVALEQYGGVEVDVRS